MRTSLGSIDRTEWAPEASTWDSRGEVIVEGSHDIKLLKITIKETQKNELQRFLVSHDARSGRGRVRGHLNFKGTQRVLRLTRGRIGCVETIRIHINIFKFYDFLTLNEGYPP